MSPAGWKPTVNNEDDWTQIGDPHKRRQVQNRISKRRQRERARQQKAKEKEANSRRYEQFFQNATHAQLRRNSSSSSLSSSHPARIRSPFEPMLYQQPPFHERSYPGLLTIPHPASSQPDHQTWSSSSYSSTSSLSMPWSQRHPTTCGTNGMPSTSIPDDMTDPSISPSPFKSPPRPRHSPLARSPQLSWPAEHTAESLSDARGRDGRLESVVPTLPSTGNRYANYSSIETSYAPSRTIESTSDNRAHETIGYSHPMELDSIGSTCHGYYSPISAHT